MASSYCLGTEKIQYQVTTKPVLFFGPRPYELQALLSTNYKHCYYLQTTSTASLGHRWRSVGRRRRRSPNYEHCQLRCINLCIHGVELQALPATIYRGNRTISIAILQTTSIASYDVSSSVSTASNNKHSLLATMYINLCIHGVELQSLPATIY